MAINERLIHTAADAAGGAASAEQNLILHLDANDVDSYDGDGSIWYDISEHDVTIPLSDNASNLKCHLNFSDSTSYGGTGTTVTDISNESNDFTFTNITASDFDKDNGGYVDLDGSADYLERSSTTSGHFNGDYTLELWINPHENNNFTYFYCKQSASLNGLLIGNFAGSTGQLEVYRYTTSGSSNSDTFTGSGITANQWNHVAIVFSGTNGFLYVNGEKKDSSTSFTGTYPADFTNMKVGGGYNTAFDTDGEIGVFRLYDKALSASEVGQNYRHGRDLVYTDLVDDTDLELHLDAGDDTTVSASTWTDLTSNSYDGTFTNFSSTLTDFYNKELGNFITFDDTNDYVKINNTGLTKSGGTDFTVEAWVRMNATGTSDYIVSQTTDDGLNQNWLLRFHSDNKIKFYVYGTDEYLSTSSTYTANVWYHIVGLVESNGTVRIYVNGELEVSSSSGKSADTVARNTFIGSLGSQQTADADIGQVRIYHKALTADQVMQNYLFTKNDYPNGFNGTISNTTWDPSGYFDFSASSNKIVVDNNKFYNNFSVSLWVKFDNVNPASGYAHNVFSKNVFYASSHTAFPFAIMNVTAGQITAALSYGNDYTSDVIATGSITANTWYHVAVTAEKGDKMKLYLTAETGTFNTTPTSEAAYTGTVIDGVNKNYTIGNSAQENGGGVGKGFLDGQISKVKMYDKVLTASEVLSQFSEGK